MAMLAPRDQCNFELRASWEGSFLFSSSDESDETGSFSISAASVLKVLLFSGTELRSPIPVVRYWCDLEVGVIEVVCHPHWVWLLLSVEIVCGGT